MVENTSRPDVFIDAEFNGFGGELMSMALVDSEGNEFYEVIQLPENTVIDPWVKENVFFVLNKWPISYENFQKSLNLFLSNNYPYGFTLIADWPDDLRHFLQAIVTGRGQMMGIFSFDMRCITELKKYKSAIPHNALEDAKGIMRKYNGLTS